MLQTVLITLMTVNISFSQSTPPDVGNYTCGSAYCLTNQDLSFSFELEENQFLYYQFHWNFLNQFTSTETYCIRIGFHINGVDLNTGNYELFGPFENKPNALCDQIQNYSLAPGVSQNFGPNPWDPNHSNFELTTTSAFQTGVPSGYFVIKINPGVLNGTMTVYGGALDATCFSCEPQGIPCEDCVTSFMPTKGTYMVSAWVKEAHSGNQPVTYEDSELLISFTGSSITYNLTPSGQIIDGWQRIEGEIIIPSEATDIHIAFVATGELDCYFDDIRFFPYDGSMMSYVYDPRTLRLMAQLDERNYATLYEYDEEGKLIRVKKETERGIMTIQENRDNIVKKP